MIDNGLRPERLFFESYNFHDCAVLDIESVNYSVGALALVREAISTCPSFAGIIQMRLQSCDT